MRITVEQFIKPCGCRSAGECQHNSTAECKALDALVDDFAAAMKSKLHRKARQGWSGWDRDDWASQAADCLIRHIRKGDPVDVANFAAFLWNMGRQADGTIRDDRNVAADEATWDGGRLILYPAFYRDAERVQMVLALTDADATADEVAAWTDEQRKAAAEWALSAHYSASDNNDVAVPPRPAFLTRNRALNFFPLKTDHA